MAILSRRVIRRNYCLAIRLDQFLLESGGATLNPEAGPKGSEEGACGRANVQDLLGQIA